MATCLGDCLFLSSYYSQDICIPGASLSPHMGKNGGEAVAVWAFTLFSRMQDELLKHFKWEEYLCLSSQFFGVLLSWVQQ